LSRKRTAVLLAIFAALAAVLSACGGGGGGSSSEDPQKVIESATFEGVKSGTMDIAMKIKSEGSEGGDLNIELSGPFQTTGKESLPELDMTVKADGTQSGEKIDFEGGITVLGDRAFIAYEGKNYEVDPTTFGFIKSGFEEAQQQGAKEGVGGETTACQKAATALDLGEFVDNMKNEGGEEVEGTATTKLSGDLNPQKAVDAIIKLVESPACSSELQQAGPLPLDELKSQSSEITDAVKKAHVDVFVGEDDNIVRRVLAKVDIEPKGEEGGELELDVTLGKVNEKQSIKAPSGAEPIEKLFGELGVNPLELLGAMSGGGGDNLGELLEGFSGGESMGGSSGAELPEEVELPSTDDLKKLEECLSNAENAESAADIQKCASLME
jgi:hypothetical protein